MGLAIGVFEGVDGGGGTFRGVAEEDVDAPEDLDGFGEGGLGAGHRSAVASDAPYPVSPTFSVLTTAFALVDQVSELGAAFLVLHFRRR